MWQMVIKAVLHSFSQNLRKIENANPQNCKIGLSMSETALKLRYLCDKSTRVKFQNML